ATGTAALALRLTSPTSPGTPDVALVATTPATLSTALQVSDVRLTGGGGGTVALLSTTRDTSIAPSLSDLGTYSVAGGHYTGVSATVGGNVRTARADITVRSGRLLPILLVVRPDSISAASGNDGVNHAVLAAAGQLIHPP